MLLVLPATAALLVIPHPIISGVFEYGSFTPEASVQTAAALAAYSLGLPAFVMAKSLTTPFFARENTATPFRYAVISVIANIALSLILSRYYAHVGIALATAAASWLNVGLLLFALLRRGYLSIDTRLWSRLARILGASIGMGGALWFADGYLAPALDGPLHLRVAALAALVAGGLAVYGALALLLGAVRLGELKDRLRRRPNPPA
jgi:putative peptidoglycan lipid II flippase